MKRSASVSPAHPMVRRSQKRMKMNEDFDDKNKNVINDKKSESMGANKPGKSGPKSGRRSSTNDRAVERIKQQATELYRKGEYNSAVVKYTKLIDMRPNNAIHYGNRAACFMMMGLYRDALEDAKKSVELDPMFIKGHSRVIKCAIILHKGSDMDSSVAKLKEIDPNNEVIRFHSQKMQELFVHYQNEVNANASKDYVKALEHIRKYLAICPLFLEYKVKKAECLVNLGRFSEAEALTEEILWEDSNNSDTHYVLGRCFYEKDIEKSMHHFEEAFRLNPDCDKDRRCYKLAKRFLEKKSEANKAYKAKNFFQAYQQYQNLYNECIENKLMVITLSSNMAQASYKLGYLDRCITECERVLHLKPDHQKALTRRAKCFMDQKNYENAVKDLEKASSIASSAQVLRMLKEARKLLQDSKNDFYSILGVVHGASKQVIQKAYKEQARVHHPDRHTNDTDEQKKFHETKCKDITRAYRLLMDRISTSQNPCDTSNEGRRRESAPKKSSGGTNDYFKTPKGSSGSSTTRNGQQSSSKSANNNPNGANSSSGRSQKYGEQPSSSGNTNNASNRQQSSSKDSDNASNGPQSSSGAHNNNRNEQRSSWNDFYDDWGEEDYDYEDFETCWSEMRPDGTRHYWTSKLGGYCGWCEHEIEYGADYCPNCDAEYSEDDY